MKQLSFLTPSRELITFIIDGKVVRYSDKMWPHGLQIYPLSHGIIKPLLDSRSERMKAYGLLIVEANKGKNLEEYEKCANEDDLCDIIRKDCKSKGLLETN